MRQRFSSLLAFSHMKKSKRSLYPCKITPTTARTMIGSTILIVLQVESFIFNGSNLLKSCRGSLLCFPEVITWAALRHYRACFFQTTSQVWENVTLLMGGFTQKQAARLAMQSVPPTEMSTRFFTGVAQPYIFYHHKMPLVIIDECMYIGSSAPCGLPFEAAQLSPWCLYWSETVSLCQPKGTS